MNPTILGVGLKFLGASWSVPGNFCKVSVSCAVETALELWLSYDCRNGLKYTCPLSGKSGTWPPTTAPAVGT
jgi:hypothetical protein